MSITTRSQLRQEKRTARRLITPLGQRQAAETVARQLRCLPRAIGAHRVAVYWPADGELETWPVLRDIWQRGGEVFLPCLDPLGGRRLRFRQLQPDGPLQPNRYGIPEPPATAPAARLWSLDWLLVPLVAFDATGNRLGMGGGFYDATLQVLRTMPRLRRPLLIGLAHTCQEVDQLLVHDSDVALDYVVTPSGLTQGSGPL